ncbi:MAG TPA: T9SS type A sorting domain-containing protein, partial [Catalimonadaceae bacterium]|nr:T9SS type A sorting domain-containing protein [Catalimonadaceae bacterium]
LHTSTGGLTPIHKPLVSSPTFSLYPNPAQHLCHLQTTSPVLEATIIDGLGRTHLFIRNPGKTLDVQDLPQGLYWVKVTTAEGVTTQRLVKE